MELSLKQKAENSYQNLYDLISTQFYNNVDKVLKYRAFLEDLLTFIISTYPNFDKTDLNSKISFLKKNNILNKEHAFYAHNIRKTGNKAAHRLNFVISNIEEKACLYCLLNVFKYLTKEPIPQNIFDYYSPYIEDIKYYLNNLELELKKSSKDTYSFYGIIEEINIPKNIDEVNHFTIKVDTDDFDYVDVKIWDNVNYKGMGSNLTLLSKILRVGDKLYFDNLLKYNDIPNTFFTTFDTLVVLNPDYLLEVTELSNYRIDNDFAYKNRLDKYELYFVDNFFYTTPNYNLFIGNVVNQILDDYIIAIKTSNVYNFDKTFEKVCKNKALDLIYLLGTQGRFNTTEKVKYYTLAKEHEANIIGVVNKYKDFDISIEPTFISDKYGLHGRLDLLIKYNDFQMDIVELKSGKRKRAIEPSHAAQTICYDLLIKSAFEKRFGDNYILYSNDTVENGNLTNGITAEKEVMALDNFSDEKIDNTNFELKKLRNVNIQKLLLTRNFIVRYELELSQGNFDIFKELEKINKDNKIPWYLKNKVDEVLNLINSLNGVSKDYFWGFLRFIYKELVIAKIGCNEYSHYHKGFSSLWNDSLQEKEDKHLALTRLKIKNIDEDFNVVFSWEHLKDVDFDVELTPFREGDYVIIYPMYENYKIDPLSNQLLKAEVKEISDINITVKLFTKLTSQQFLRDFSYWCIESYNSDMNIKVMLKSLYAFMRGDDRVRELVLCKRRPEFDNAIKIKNDRLDEYQILNVEKAVNAKDYYLIQGPPGSGKTSGVLVEIVKNLLEHDEKDIYIIAYTNRAVDEIIGNLIKNNIECLKIGDFDGDNGWKFLVNNHSLEDVYYKFKKTRVIVSTVLKLQFYPHLLKVKQFGTLIVDEATQILEPMIVGLLSYFDKWILIGDENQLPAVTEQSTSAKCNLKSLNDIGLYSFAESLFLRLKVNAINKGWDDCYGMLQYHYRMHEKLAEFVNNEFYNNKLIPKTNRQKNKIVGYNCGDVLLDKIFSNNRVAFISTPIQNSNKINDYEAKLVARIVEYVHKIYGDNFDYAKSLGVITPFKAQILNIKKYLKPEYKNITIDTVERYQGSERDIIIISFALNNPFMIFSVKSESNEIVDRKLNVALTRAKDHLVLIGNDDILKSDPIYHKLLKYIEKENGIYRIGNSVDW